MLNSPLEILLSPILIAQGLYTKYKTPRLSEPQGLRQGSVGHGKPLRVLVCGDSAAAGVGAEQQTQALSGQLLKQLDSQYLCHWCLEAKSGYSSADLIQHLTELTAQPFDIAVVSIGVNDVIKPLSITTWLKNMAQIQQLLRKKFAVHYIIYTAVPPMHQFPALPLPLRYFLGKTAKKMNVQLQQQYADRENSTVLNLQLPLEQGYMANDGFHPSPLAYSLWAQHVAALIQAWQNNQDQFKQTKAQQN